MVQSSDAGTDLRMLLTYTDGHGKVETIVSNIIDPVHGSSRTASAQPATAAGQSTAASGANPHVSTAADETLTGGSGVDVFRFAKLFGHDTVAQFTPGEDVIEFQSGIFASIEDLLAHHAVQTGSDVVISDGFGDTLTLKNVALASLHASDFHVV